MVRIRLVYAVRGYLRFTGSLDLQRIWERSLRRARLPLSYSQGFHPQPKIQQAFPLPLGICSEAEIIDIWFESQITSENIELLKSCLPSGLEILSFCEVPIGNPTLMSHISACNYHIKFLPRNYAHLEHQINEMISKKEIIRTRRSRQYDLRPLILQIDTTFLPNELQISLKAGPNQTGRPEEVIDELGCDLGDCLITRTAILYLV